MDRIMLKDVLTGYDTWVVEQDGLDYRFINGQFTKWEYIKSCMELLAERMPVSDGNVRSLSYE